MVDSEMMSGTLITPPVAGISPPNSSMGAEAEQACLSQPSRGTRPFGWIGLVDTLKVTACVRRLHVGKVKY